MNTPATALLSTTYFGPVQWYQKLYRYDCVLIEQHETFQKQTYRNRCLIATTQGIQALTVPVIHPSDEEMVNGSLGRRTLATQGTQEWSMVNVRLSDHGNWRHLHWQALQSAYGDSPFFEFYADDLRPFFEQRWDYLLDFNEAIRQKMCELLDIHPHVEYTTEYLPNNSQFTIHNSQFIIQNSKFKGLTDFRNAIAPKHPGEDPDFEPRRYYQVFEQKHGFLPNLSILDLLFNMGPESIYFL